MPDLYPAAPHLSVFVHPRTPISDALLEGADVLQSLGCTLSDEFLIYRGQEMFEAATNVEREMVRYNGGLENLMNGESTVMRIGFVHRRFGRVSLGYASTSEATTPSLEVALHAGPLSMPAELWSRHERRGSKNLVAWSEGLLPNLAGVTGAPYGAIGIESIFPAPGALKATEEGSPWRPYTWFWSRDVSEALPSEEGRLLKHLDSDAISNSSNGTVFHGWQPSHHDGADNDGIGKVVAFLATYYRRQ